MDTVPSQEELRLALHLDEVDIEDLVEVLVSYFHGARHESPREIAFPNDGEAKLTLHFSKDLRRCDYATAAPDLTDAAIAEIAAKVQDEVVYSTGTRCGTVVLFSLERVTGSWRYEDRLQLRPLPEASPRPPVLYADHPLLVDFTYRGSSDLHIDVGRRQRAATRWTQRLNLLLRPGVESMDDSAHHQWVVVQDELGQAHSEYLQIGYMPVGLTFSPDAVPPFVPPALERTNADAYYAEQGTRLEPMKLPTSLEQSIAGIEGLPAEVLLRFDRAAYWFYCARHLVREHSLMAVALGAAIEAMFEPDPSAARCPTCNREMHRPTARFIEFMSANLTSDDGASARDLFADFYGLRSRPAHGHVFDSDFVPLPAFTPSRLGEEEQVRTLFTYVQIALVNWLEAQRVRDVPRSEEAATPAV